VFPECNSGMEMKELPSLAAAASIMVLRTK